MASKVDMSLDDLVQGGRKKGPPGRFNRGKQSGAQKMGRFQQSQNEKGASAKAAGGGKFADLRDVLAKKQKTNVGDLRSKLKPKALYTSKNTKSQPISPQSSSPSAKSPSFAPKRSTQSSRAHFITPMKPISVDDSSPSPPAPRFGRPSRRSDPVPVSQRQRSMPSYDEAKKITVTVPGLRSPPASSEYSHHRREQRLAAAIARSKEHRHDSYMRGREEALASAISSAFVGGGGGAGESHHSNSHHHHPRERERSHHHQSHAGSSSYHPRSQLRGYSPSPSPPPGMGYDSHYGLPAPPPPPPPISRGAYSSSSGHHSSKGITTLTSMVISNLSDTVSKNDVAELCSAVGPLEGVYMPAAGMAEVVFKYKDDALEAYKKYNQRNLDGQPMMCRVHPTSRSRLSGYGHSSYSDDIYGGGHSGFY